MSNFELSLCLLFLILLQCSNGCRRGTWNEDINRILSDTQHLEALTLEALTLPRPASHSEPGTCANMRKPHRNGHRLSWAHLRRAPFCGLFVWFGMSWLFSPSSLAGNRRRHGPLEFHSCATIGTAQWPNVNDLESSSRIGFHTWSLRNSGVSHALR